MGIENWLLLSRLRRTVEKIRLLLKLNNINKWRLAAMVGGAASRNRRRLSFNDRPGLRAVCSEDDEDDSNQHPGSSSRELQRTTSYTSSSSSTSDDVDKRAEMFIANFYRQLKMERQVSLQLRYCRGNSFDSSVSP